MRFIWSPVAVTSTRESLNVTKHYVNKNFTTQPHPRTSLHDSYWFFFFFISSGDCLTSQTTSPMTQHSLCPDVLCCDWGTLATEMTNSASKASLVYLPPDVAPHSPSLRPFLRQRTLGIWASSWQSSAGGGEQRRWDVMVEAEHTLRNTPLLSLRHSPTTPPPSKTHHTRRQLHTLSEGHLRLSMIRLQTHHTQTFIRVLRLIRNTSTQRA